MAKNLKPFGIYAKVTIDAGITIKAESFEDALEKAQSLHPTDFVKVLDEYNDGELKINGVFDNS